MTPVNLALYDNTWYRPGRGFVVRSLWYFLGHPIVSCSFMPSSFLRSALLRLFGARIGNGVVLHHGIKVKYPWHLEIGANSWIGEDCWIDNLTQVTIGAHVCLSQGVYICTGNHNWSTPTFDLIVKPVTICDGAWVGAKCILAPGVVVEECSVAAAGSVVVRDVPGYEVHAGNPAAYVRRRAFTERLDRVFQHEP